MIVMTPEQERVYRIILNREIAGERPPTIREIADDVGCQISLAYRRVQALQKKGYLNRPHRREWRALRTRVKIY